jgi:superfamily II DNA helicase RecQ
MSDDEKKAALEGGRRGRARVMGVDYGAVRFVVHSGLADTLLDYAQESGRGGRDGRRADAVVV